MTAAQSGINLKLKSCSSIEFRCRDIAVEVSIGDFVCALSFHGPGLPQKDHAVLILGAVADALLRSQMAPSTMCTARRCDQLPESEFIVPLLITRRFSCPRLFRVTLTGLQLYRAALAVGMRHWHKA